MSRSQWFLAHSKKDEMDDVNVWCQQLSDALSQDGWTATVISGRDDYDARSAALGGWNDWCRDVPCGVDYTGAPLYHGVIVPIDSVDEAPTIGRATAQILMGFLAESKHVYAWCPHEKSFREVSKVEEVGEDSWVSWARLEFNP